jgi:chromosomal replication initiation ATPase DnaA
MPMIALNPELSCAVRRRRENPENDRMSQALGSIVAAAFGLGLEDLRSTRRGAAEISFARLVAMYLAHTRLGLPLAVTGRLFGRDRTTARHACRQVEDRREDPRVDGLIDCLERALDLSVDLGQFSGSRRPNAG